MMTIEMKHCYLQHGRYRFPFFDTPEREMVMDQSLDLLGRRHEGQGINHKWRGMARVLSDSNPFTIFV